MPTSWRSRFGGRRQLAENECGAVLRDRQWKPRDRILCQRLDLPAPIPSTSKQASRTVGPRVGRITETVDHVESVRRPGAVLFGRGPNRQVSGYLARQIPNKNVGSWIAAVFSDDARPVA